MSSPDQVAIESQSLVQQLRRVLTKQIIQHSAIFGIAEVVNKAIPFLLMPVVTRYLVPAEYGYVATFAALVNIVTVFVNLNVHGAVNVNYFQLARDQMATYVASMVSLLFLAAALVALVLGVFIRELSAQIQLPGVWILLSVVMALGQSVTLLNLVLWQAEQRPKAYGIYQISQSLLVVGLSLLLVVVYRFGWVGQTSANLAGAVTFGLLSLGFLGWRNYLRPRFEWEHVKDALAFGLPLVPHALAGWFLTGIDRFFLTAMVGAAATGEYAAGYQFGLIIGIVAASFNRAWMPFLFQRLTAIDAAGKLRIVKLTYLYFAAILTLALGLALVAPWVIRVLLGTDFQDARRYVLWVALAFAFDGMYYMVVNQIFFVKKTRWLAVITFSTGAIHVLVSYLCIKNFGSIGAAYATSISFGVTFGLVWILSARVYPMPWNPFKW